MYICDITNSMLATLSDSDAKIRFHSLESLYFVCKSCGEIVLLNFNQIFENLVNKVADLDEGKISLFNFYLEVRKAA